MEDLRPLVAIMVILAMFWAALTYAVVREVTPEAVGETAGKIVRSFHETAG